MDVETKAPSSQVQAGGVAGAPCLSVQGRASLGTCGETAVMSWASAKSKP